MKKILVTGAKGFIGQHAISLLLKRGYEVHATSSRCVKKDPSSDIHWHQTNLLNYQETDRLLEKVTPTHLLHLAWYVVPGLFWSAQENLHWVSASLHLVQNFIKYGGKKVVVAGTCAEYDPKYGYCQEKITLLSPTTLYAISKHSLHKMLTQFCSQKDVMMTWGRIFYLYGSHEHPNRLVSSVIRSLLKNEPAKCSHGRQIRDFLHVKDVAKAFVMLLENDVQGEVNIASGSPCAIKDLIYEIAAQLGKSELVQLGALPVPVQDPHFFVGSNERLKNEVGWSQEYELSQGIAETINWWKNHLEGEKV